MSDSDNRNKNIRRDRRTEEKRARLRDNASADKTSAPQSQRAAGSSARERRSRRKSVLGRVPLRIRLFALAAVLIIVSASFGIYRLVDYLGSRTSVRLTDEGFRHAEVFADCVALNGIDVSVYQGDDIDWKKAKTSGVDFVFVRAGYRAASNGNLHEDSYFRQNIEGAQKAGIMTGVYFYSQALTPEEAEEEADYCLSLIKGYDLDMPVAIDFEIYNDGRLHQKIKAGELYASSMYHDIVLAFCRKVENAGYESLVYANQDMLTHYMDASVLDDSADIWLAQYSSMSELDAGYRFWQCSDSASAGGISGGVDHDFWYVEPGKVYPTRAAGSVGKRTSIGDCQYTFNKETYKLKSGRATPKITMMGNGWRMRKNRDYTVSVVRNTEPGTGYVIIRGIGNYEGWMMVPFTIE